MTTRIIAISKGIRWEIMTTRMVELSSVTELPSRLGVGPVTQAMVAQFLTLVIECNIVYLILEFSHIKVGPNIN